MSEPTLFPCPACGSMLTEDGSCTNKVCESHTPDTPEFNHSKEAPPAVTRTMAEWKKELDVEVDDDSSFRDSDGELDKERRYTQEDFLRRAGLGDE